MTAQDYFADGEPIGEKGNIKKEEKLLIEKFPESSEEKSVWATPVEDFVNGETLLS